MSEQQITIIGNLTGDPELRFIQSGAAVVNFTVAQTPRKYNSAKKEWEDGETNFWRCSLWREQAESVAESLTKGARVILVGEIQSRSWEQDGQKRSDKEVRVDEIGPSLKYATAKVTRSAKSSGSTGGFGSTPTPSTESDPWANVPASDEPPF